MEGTSHRGKRVLVVRREYERSRLEQAQLAAAYERVLPEVRVVLAESRYRAKPVCVDGPGVRIGSGRNAVETLCHRRAFS